MDAQVTIHHLVYGQAPLNAWVVQIKPHIFFCGLLIPSIEYSILFSSIGPKLLLNVRGRGAKDWEVLKCT